MLMRLPSSWLVALPEDWQTAGFGLYLHWPFCQAKCPYCDFNSHVVSQIDEKRWETAYLHEISRIGAETEGRVLRSVFLGGGTPSMMSRDLVAAIIDRIRTTWSLANDCEITLEANPTSVEAARFTGYREAGVNRVSLGVQALNDPDLKALGRLHSAEEALRAFDLARSVFDRVSFDLIYARQGQTLEQWREELEQAIALSPDHLSLYQLTIEDGTAFGDRFAAGKLRNLPTDDLAADMYFATQEICEAHGYGAYEVSNHAQRGQESRHNIIYWQSGDYAGIGPGAHGRLTLGGERWATSTPLGPSDWLRQVETTGNGESPREYLDPAERLTEFLLMGLRLRDGVSMDRLKAFGEDKLYININRLVESGSLNEAGGMLFVSAEHRPILNAVLREVLRD